MGGKVKEMERSRREQETVKGTGSTNKVKGQERACIRKETTRKGEVHRMGHDFIGLNAHVNTNT